MAIPSIGGGGSPIATADQLAARLNQGNDTTMSFLDYMKKTPAERMQEAWLQAHGITKEKFDAMSPEEKKKLMDQMAREIKDKLQKQAEEAAQKKPAATV